MTENPDRPRPFHLLLIKPSHYDDDGYVIQWWRSSLPSNSLAAVYGIAQDCAQRRVLGEDVEIRIRALDETNTRIDPRRLIREMGADGGQALVGMVGVQSNQYPRALDIARRFREAGLPVVIGGFHVSGCLAMLKQLPRELQEALDLGISLFAGELEGRLDGLLADAAEGRLKPVYDYLNDLPDMTGKPTPYLPPDRVRLTMGKRASFDAGRGCPYLCSFCTIINVQGRKSRHRDADDVERLIRANAADGIGNFFITDDNFARNRNWEPIFDRVIELRESGMDIRLVIQVDTQSHRIPRFIEKAGRAGVTRAFIGMENINPDSLKAAQKGQNKITDYRAMLQAWHRAGVLTYAGYIIGFPTDTPESIRRDIEIVKRELPIDIMEFFILTPLPGSKDHQRLVEEGVPLDPDMNNYDTQHVTADHPRMSKAEWEAIYREVWDLYYTDEHVATILRRARAWGYDPKQMLAQAVRLPRARRLRGDAPPRGGPDQAQGAAGPSPRLPDRESARFLPAVCLGVGRQVRGCLWHASALQTHPECRHGGHETRALQRHRDAACRAGGGGDARAVHRHRLRPGVRRETADAGGTAWQGGLQRNLAAVGLVRRAVRWDSTTRVDVPQLEREHDGRQREGQAVGEDDGPGVQENAVDAPQGDAGGEHQVHPQRDGACVPGAEGAHHLRNESGRGQKGGKCADQLVAGERHGACPRVSDRAAFLC